MKLTPEELLVVLKLHYTIQNMEIKQQNLQLQLEVLNRDIAAVNLNRQNVNSEIAEKYQLSEFNINLDTGEIIEKKSE
jgi:hypothetical protein